MLTYSTLKDWLETLEVDIDRLNQGPFIPSMPDRLITVTMLPGAGYDTDEGALDQPTFQIRCRSAQGDQTSAESDAFEIDKKIFGAPFPALVDGVRIVLVTRLAGAPAPLGPPDDGDRFDYVCTYRAVVSN
jgi:Bacteriophage minor capsid protein